MDSELRALLVAWDVEKKKLAEMKPVVEEERRLRNLVMGKAFPAPKEGTNTFELPEGWKLKGKHKINRKVEKAMVPTVSKQLAEKFQVSLERFIEYTPELLLKEYRTMTDEQRKCFDGCLIITPGSPELELVPPKT